MLSVTLVSFAALILFSGVHADKALSLALSGPSEVHDVDNFAVITKITNTGSETVRLYKDPHSAIDAFPENTFTVTSSDGDAVEFIGPHVKWSYEANTEFITLTPGESREVTHQLGEAYNFTKPAKYFIAPHATFYAAPEGESSSPVVIVASLLEAKYTATLSGSLVSTVVAKRIEESALLFQARSLEKRATFNGCSASQKVALVTAAANSLNLTGNAISKLTILPNTPRYRKWFGAYTVANKDVVLNRYKLIRSGNPNNYLYDCTCTQPGAISYVYAGTFGKLYLCPAFWSLPALGKDSKAGTIIRESSYFIRNGNVYTGPATNCAALAISNPSRAINYPECYEYFAENTPSLP